MPVTALMVGGAVAPLVGQGIGYLLSADEREAKKQALIAREEAQKQALAQVLGIQIPTVESQQLNLGQYASQGQLTPEQEAALQQEQTALAGIQVDPRLKQAQMQALEQIQGMTSAQLTPAEESAHRQLMRGVSGQEQARQASILQNMAQRGMGGSGSELAAALSSSQASSNRAAEESDRIAQMAQARALQAMSQSGALAGKVRQQEFGEQADIARAKDIISQFNASQKAQVQQRNVSGKNTAAATNLSAAQRLADANIDLANKQQAYNKELIAAKAAAEAKKAGLVSNAYTGQANYQGTLAGEAAETGKQNEATGASFGKAAGQLGTLGAAALSKTPATPYSTATTPMDIEEQLKKAKKGTMFGDY